MTCWNRYELVLDVVLNQTGSVTGCAGTTSLYVRQVLVVAARATLRTATSRPDCWPRGCCLAAATWRPASQSTGPAAVCWTTRRRWRHPRRGSSWRRRHLATAEAEDSCWQTAGQWGQWGEWGQWGQADSALLTRPSSHYVSLDPVLTTSHLTQFSLCLPRPSSHYVSLDPVLTMLPTT